jgi:hypothetical protein
VLETRPTSSSVGADARRDMHSDAADVVVAAFNLSGVNDGAHVEAHGSRRHVGARRDEGTAGPPSPRPHECICVTAGIERDRERPQDQGVTSTGPREEQ